MSELDLILLGPARGRQGHAGRAPATPDFGLPHISTGDILRAAVKDGTELGKQAKAYMDAGDLVPDDVVIGMIRRAPGARTTRATGFMLDGFPRTIEQAEALDAQLVRARAAALTAVLLIDVPDEERRPRVCRAGGSAVKAGHVYHVDFDPPKHEGICDLDGSGCTSATTTRGDGPQPARGLPRADRAADRLLRGAGPAAPRSTGPASPTRSMDTFARRSRPLRLEEDV